MTRDGYPTVVSHQLPLVGALVLLNSYLLYTNTVVDPDRWTFVFLAVWHALFAWQVLVARALVLT